MEVGQVVENGSRCEISVIMSKEEVDREQKLAVTQIKGQAEVPGFRKGLAPAGAVFNRYRNHILNIASEQLVYQGTEGALKDKKLRNVSSPELLPEFRRGPSPYLGVFSLDGSFRFTFAVELPPEVDVKDYVGVQARIPHSNSTFEPWFREQLRPQLLMYGTKLTATRPVRRDDEVIADFEAFIEGTALYREENYRLNIGSDQMPRAFESAFLDKQTGEEFWISVEMPNEDGISEQLRGKVCDFKCLIREVVEVQPHDLNDDFAVLSGYESLDTLRQSYKDRWNTEFAQPMRAQTYSAVMDVILKANPFEAPKVWVEREANATLQRLQGQNLRGNEQLMVTLRQMSERNVKAAYLLEKIYEKEQQLHFTPEEFMKRAETVGQQYGLSAGDFIEKLKEQGQYEGFVVQQEQERVIDFLLEKSVIEEIDGSKS